MSDTNNEQNESKDLSHVKVSGQGIFTGENKPDPAKLTVDFDKHQDLEIKHGVALIDFVQLVNKQFAEINTPHSDADSVQEVLDDFVNEVDDLPRKKMNTFKREKVSNKVLALAEAVMKVLPHTDKTFAAFAPLAPFGELVGKNIEHIMKVKYGEA